MANAKITRPSAGSTTKPGDLVLIKETNSTIHRSINKGKLKPERCTSPSKVGAVSQPGPSVKVVMIEGCKMRTRQAPTRTIKPFHI